MLNALADGETDPAALVVLADPRLHATQQQLRDALAASKELNGVYRRLIKMALEELRFIERQMDHLDHEIADLLSQHHDASWAAAGLERSLTADASCGRCSAVVDAGIVLGHKADPVTQVRKLMLEELERFTALQVHLRAPPDLLPVAGRQSPQHISNV